MGLFDFLSGSDEARDAAAANQAASQLAFAQQGNVANQYRTGATDALSGARTAALGELGTGLEGQLGALRSGLGTLQGIDMGPLRQALATLQGTGTAPLESALGEYRNALGAVQSGAGGALAAGQAGVGAYAPLTRLGESYAPMVDAYKAALGPGGEQTLQDRFISSPGYKFAVDEATKAAANKAASLGIAGSGNTLDEIRSRAQGFAAQDYGNWRKDYLDRLAGFVSPQLAATGTAASGISGANRTLADIYRTGGADTAAAYGQIGKGYGDIFTGGRGIAQDVAGAYGSLYGAGRDIARDINAAYGGIGSAYGTSGAQRAGIQSGYGSDIANVLGNVAGMQSQSVRDLGTGTINANNLIAQAGQNDASFWQGLLGNVGKAAAGSYFGVPTGK